MTSQRVERTWIRTGGYRRFGGEWVKLRAITHDKYMDRFREEIDGTTVPHSPQTTTTHHHILENCEHKGRLENDSMFQN